MVAAYGLLNQIAKVRPQCSVGAYPRENHFPSTQNSVSNKFAEKINGIDAFYLIPVHSRASLNLLH